MPSMSITAVWCWHWLVCTVFEAIAWQCMPWKLSFVLKIPSTIDISIHDSFIQRDTGDGNSQLPDGLKQGIAIMEMLNSVSVLQNGVPFPFWRDFLYTVVVTASLKRIPETELQDQKPPIESYDFRRVRSCFKWMSSWLEIPEHLWIILNEVESWSHVVDTSELQWVCRLK